MSRIRLTGVEPAFVRQIILAVARACRVTNLTVAVVALAVVPLFASPASAQQSCPATVDHSWKGNVQACNDKTFRTDPNPPNPYCLDDLDGRPAVPFAPLAARDYYASKWGNIMSEFKDFSALMTGPAQTVATPATLMFTPLTRWLPDLFVQDLGSFTQSVNQRELALFPFPTGWSDGPISNTDGGKISHPGPGRDLRLFRKLNFENALNGPSGSPIVVGSATKLIVLIHGWNPGSVEDKYQDSHWKSLVIALSDAIARSPQSGWQLVLYHWERDSDTGLATLTGGAIHGTRAAEIGHQHGQHLGEVLEKTACNLTQVHFIAHSAGSWVARAAIKHLLNYKQNVKTQLTLLDPYVPGNVPFVDSSLTQGRMQEINHFPNATSASLFLLENYYADKHLCIELYWCVGDIALGTNSPFTWRTTDTALQVSWGGAYYLGHGGPVLFYADTVRAALGTAFDPGLEGPQFDLSRHGWKASMMWREQVPTIPKLLNANVVAATQVDLTWQPSIKVASTDPITYQIYRNDAPLGTPVVTPSFSDASAVPLTQACYAVEALAGGAGSGKSAPVCATLPAPPSSSFVIPANYVSPYTATQTLSVPGAQNVSVSIRGSLPSTATLTILDGATNAELRELNGDIGSTFVVAGSSIKVNFSGPCCATSTTGATVTIAATTDTPTRFQVPANYYSVSYGQTLTIPGASNLRVTTTGVLPSTATLTILDGATNAELRELNSDIGSTFVVAGSSIKVNFSGPCCATSTTGATVTIAATTDTPTRFQVPANYYSVSYGQTLTIPGASNLRVTTTGVLPSTATLTILNGATNALVRQVTGDVGSTFVVAGSGIKVNFSGPCCATSTTGAAVQIEARDTAVASAVLPTGRSVQVGVPFTAFATIENGGSVAATRCGIVPLVDLPLDFGFQTTDGATNAVTGTPNTLVDIPANGRQSFVIFGSPMRAFLPINLQLGFQCSNAALAPIFSGINTLELSASNTPVPDVIALSATVPNDGIVRAPSNGQFGFFALATINVGGSGAITVVPDTGSATLPITVWICETIPSTGACLAPWAASVSTSIATNGTSTFAVFVSANGSVPFDPAGNRIYVRFKDAAGVSRGGTSVAVMTQ